MPAYHYYPRLKKLVRQEPKEPNYEYLAVSGLSSRPATPPLTRSATSTPVSSPSTPPSVPVQMARASHVGFKSEVRSRRAPRVDELILMSDFARHASHCQQCSSPYRTWRRGDQLCERGRGYARAVVKYIYSKDGIPHSVIDRNKNNETIEIEIPYEYGVVKELIEAYHRGLSLRSSQPVVSYDPNYYVPSRRNTVHIYNERGHGVEIKPSSSHPSRQERERFHSEPNNRQSRSAIVRDRRGSLYLKDEEAKQYRDKWNSEAPYIIYAGPNKRKTVYLR